MKKSFILVVVLLSSISLMAVWYSVNETYTEQIICNQLAGDHMEISFHLDGYQLENVVGSGKTYQRVSHPEGGRLLEAGMPDLPIFTVMVAIPNEGEVSYRYQIIESETIEGLTLYPCQDLKQETEEFALNREYYKHGSLFPEEKVTTVSPAIMRDLRIVTLSICPFTYNAQAKELEIVSEMSIELQITGSGGENLKRRNSAISRAFEPLYKKLIINYDEIMERPTYQQPTLVYIIPDIDDVLETLEYLKDWKRQKGYNVVVATTSETGSTSNSIKNWLQDAYDTWENPPEYVCFCGDANGSYTIPTWGNGDHEYSELEGNDYLADVFLGRLSFQNNLTFQNLVAKVINYEREPFMSNTEWYSQAVLAGDPSISGPSMVFTCQSVKEMMLDYPDNFDGDDNFTEIYGGNFPSSINNAINAGVSYMVYRGWLNMSGWSPGGQSNSFMLPFATILTCGTGSWTYGTSDSEEFIQMGSVTNPTGAIGCVGMSTSGTHSCFNNALTLGIYGSIFCDGIYSIGGATTVGKYYLHYTFPQNPSGYVTTYNEWANLMGEASLEVWTDVPEELTAIYDDDIALGSCFLPVEVRDNTNAPLEGAWVTLTNESESFFVTGFCDTNGEVLLDLSGIESGEYDFVVTSHNYIPHLGTITVEQADQYPDISSVNYDDTSGNGDGVLNPGEIVLIYPSLTNYGTQAITGIEVDCILNHSYMSLNTSQLEYPDLSAGGTEEPVDGLELEINPSALGNMQGLLELEIEDNNGNSWTTWHYLNIEGANLFASEYEVVGTGILEPGQLSELIFTLENTGNVVSEELDLELVCLNPRLIITDSLGTIGAILPGESGSNSVNTFEVTPSVTVIPGSQIQVEIHASSASGYYQICPITLAVGTVEVTDPLGPDEYGYWCYDDADVGYESCPSYNWIEIDPDLGGSGTVINLNDSGNDGDSEVIMLPDEFNLSFYGEQYEEMTVCSNGWIAPGMHEGANFMNHPLPGPQGPSPMIAVFWDDLNVSPGNVCWYYDSIDHVLIVEWSEIKNGDTNADETFQVILYDPDYYQTTTGDCLIKMQYMEVNNNNAGSYPYNHGQFCTIGLESENALSGLTYTFNNDYPESCKELEDEMAILFTPPQQPEFGPYLEMAAYEYISGDDEFIEAGEEVIMSILIGNQGAEGAEDIEVEMTIEDQWFTVTEGYVFVDYIEPLGLLELNDEFRFEVSEEIPDNYEFDVTITMSTEDDLWYSSFSLTAHWTNAFLLDTDSIDVVLAVDHLTERTFNLTNISAQTVNYYLRMEDDQTTRDITGSYVTCENTVFYPGTEMQWIFTVFNNSTTNEWVTDVWLTFPPGISVLTAGNVVGGSGGLMNWDGTTGDDVTVNWHGETVNGWGVLHNGESASWVVNVSIGENFASDIQLVWEIQGDGYGADPHNVTGELNFDYPIQWISLNTSYGSLEAGETDEITIYYDTEGMELGEYNCTINILSDSWFADQVITNLTVVAVEETPDQINPVTELAGNFPNPFNPSTQIQFSLAEQEHVEMTIYNIKGQKVCTLLDQALEPGNHSVNWEGVNDNGSSVSSGIYYLRFKTPSCLQTGKLLLLK